MTFKEIKHDIAKSVLTVIDNKTTLIAEADASEFAMASTLSQGARLIKFFLYDNARLWKTFGKEALSIVEIGIWW